MSQPGPRAYVRPHQHLVAAIILCGSGSAKAGCGLDRSTSLLSWYIGLYKGIRKSTLSGETRRTDISAIQEVAPCPVSILLGGTTHQSNLGSAPNDLLVDTEVLLTCRMRGLRKFIDSPQLLAASKTTECSEASGCFMESHDRPAHFPALFLQNAFARILSFMLYGAASLSRA